MLHQQLSQPDLLRHALKKIQSGKGNFIAVCPMPQREQPFALVTGGSALPIQGMILRLEHDGGTHLWDHTNFPYRLIAFHGSAKNPPFFFLTDANWVIQYSNFGPNTRFDFTVFTNPFPCQVKDDDDPEVTTRMIPIAAKGRFSTMNPSELEGISAVVHHEYIGKLWLLEALELRSTYNANKMTGGTKDVKEISTQQHNAANQYAGDQWPDGRQPARLDQGGIRGILV